MRQTAYKRLLKKGKKVNKKFGTNLEIYSQPSPKPCLMFYVIGDEILQINFLGFAIYTMVILANNSVIC